MILLYHDNVYSERKKTLTPLSELNGTDLFQVESQSSKDALCQVWLIMAPWPWRRRFLNFVKSLNFRNFVILVSHWKETWSFFEHPKCFVPFFCWNWPSGSGLYFCQYIFSILLFVPLRSPWFEQTWISFTNNA